MDVVRDRCHHRFAESIDVDFHAIGPRPDREMLAHGEAAPSPRRRVQPRLAPERRVQAVGGNDEPRADVAVGGMHDGPGGAPVDAAHRRPVGDDDAELGRPPCHGLDQHGAPDAEAAPARQREHGGRAVLLDESNPREGAPVGRCDLRQDAQSFERADGGGQQPLAAGLVRRKRALLEHQHRRAALGGDDRRRQTRRAAADDDHVVRGPVQRMTGSCVHHCSSTSSPQKPGPIDISTP